MRPGKTNLLRLFENAVEKDGGGCKQPPPQTKTYLGLQMTGDVLVHLEHRD